MDASVVMLANVIYGENGGEDYNTMVMTGSSVLNRMNANRPQEFGGTMEEVINKGYYAAKNNSPMYQQATTGVFPDKASENAYKKALQVSYGLISGKINRHSAQFFFKKNEASGLRKKLKSQGKVGKYQTYSY